MLVLLAVVVELSSAESLHELRHIRAVRVLHRLFDRGVRSTVTRSCTTVLDQAGHERWSVADEARVAIHSSVLLSILNLLIVVPVVQARLWVESCLLRRHLRIS